MAQTDQAHGEEDPLEDGEDEGESIPNTLCCFDGGFLIEVQPGRTDRFFKGAEGEQVFVVENFFIKDNRNGRFNKLFNQLSSYMDSIVLNIVEGDWEGFTVDFKSDRVLEFLVENIQYFGSETDEDDQRVVLMLMGL